MIVEKIFLKKLNIHLAFCKMWNGYLQDIFCRRCSKFISEDEKTIECDFKPKPDFLHNMEMRTSDSQRLQDELKDKFSKTRMFGEFSQIVNKKESKKGK